MAQHEATKTTKDPIEVHRHLGPGLLDSVYEAAPCQELWLRRVVRERKVPIKIVYKGHLLAGGVRPDLLVERSLVVEVKAVAELAAIHRSQLLAYLKVSGYQVGLLINFNVRLLRHGMRRVLVG